MTQKIGAGRPTKTQLLKLHTKKRKFLDKFEELSAKIHMTCAAEGISGHTYLKWMEQDPEFATEVKRIVGVHMEKVELSLLNLGTGKIKGNPTALISYLNNKVHHYDGWNYQGIHYNRENNFNRPYELKYDIETPQGISDEISRLIHMMGSREITVEYGNSLINMLEVKLKLFEPIEFDKRLKELEDIDQSNKEQITSIHEFDDEFEEGDDEPE